MDIIFSNLEANKIDQTGSHLGFENFIIYGKNNYENIGYIKLSLLKKETFENLFPTVWHYMKHWKGWVNLELSDLSSEEFVNSALTRLVLSSSLKKMNLKQKFSILKSFAEEFEQDMQKSKDFFEDKPFVSYIEIDAKFRKLGYSLKFYENAAKEVINKWGQSLYSDTCQTESAKGSWNKLVSTEKAIFLKNRYMFLSR